MYVGTCVKCVYWVSQQYVTTYVCSVVLLQVMTARPDQRPNGLPRDKICQYKLVLLGKKFVSHDLLLL